MSVVVSDGFAYVAAYISSALQVVDIRDPGNPKPVAAISGLTGIRNLVKKDNYLYAAVNGLSGGSLIIFDVTTSTDPKIVGVLSQGEREPGSVKSASGAYLQDVYSMAVAGNNLYAISYTAWNTSAEKAFNVIDISSSTRPVLMAGLGDGEKAPGIGTDGARLKEARSIYLSGNRAFVTSFRNGDLEVIDISSSTRPEHITSLRTGENTPGHISGPGAELDYSFGLTVLGNYAYLTSYLYNPPNSKNNLEVVDVGGVLSYCAVGSPNDVSSLLALNSPPASQDLPWYSRLWSKMVAWAKQIFGREVVAVSPPILKWCTGSDWGYPEVVNTAGTLSRIRIKLTQPLSFDSDYAIILKDGLRDSLGVSTATTTKWRFVTGGKICEVDKVNVVPDQYYYSRAYSTSTFETETLSDDKQQIQSVLGYAWEFLWGPKTSEIITFVNASATTTTNTIRAENRNGETDAWASANVTDNKYTFRKGIMATGRTHLIVFLCENPWPPKDLFINDGGGVISGPFTIFPYQDKDNNNDNYNLTQNTFDNTPLPASTGFGDYFNFSAYYCADNGAPVVSDDLPYLRPAVQTAASILDVNTALKRFILSNNKNDDGIGIQVFPNSEHLSAREWFNYAKTFGGQGFCRRHARH